MDNSTGDFYHNIVKMHPVNLSCETCGLYSGDFEDTGNGFHIVHCEDGRVRCTTLDAGCSSYEADMFLDVKDVQ